MAIELDHCIVSAHDKRGAGRMLAKLLDVRCGDSQVGPFFDVYINDGLTLAFFETEEDFPVEHYCFRVGDEDFDAILARINAAGIKYRSAVRGPEDMQVSTQFGGRSIYWNEPEGHQWEILTVSYARPPA